MGQLFSKLNKRRNSGAKDTTAEQAKTELKEDEQKEQTLAQKADSMQEVMPNIFMGSYAAAKDKELLQNHKITHILAIGWDLKAYFENDFKYLIFSEVEDNPAYTILQHFDDAFKFMDSCLVPNSNANANANTNDTSNENESKTEQQQKQEPGNILVHCHKGLSRSASIIMGYEMSRKNKTFEQVLNEIRESRSFIMPNIGFQAQLQVFEEKKYSLNMKDYDDLDVMSRISNIIPRMYDSVAKYESYYKEEKEDLVDGQDLFGLTMYFHQLFMLHRERDLPEKDVKLLNDAIKLLYKIQTDYIKIDSSITRFEKLFKLGKYNKPSKKEIAKQKKMENKKEKIEKEKEKEKEQQKEIENANKQEQQQDKDNENKSNNDGNNNDSGNNNNDKNENKTETFLGDDQQKENSQKKDRSPQLNATPAAETAMLTALDAATQASEAEDDSQENDNGNGNGNGNVNNNDGAVDPPADDNAYKE